MLSLTEQFLAWCRSKPADERFNVCDARACAYYQFATEHGLPEPVVLIPGDMPGPIGEAIYRAAQGGDKYEPSPTFGTLADCIEAVLAERVERQLVEQVRA